MLFSIWSCAFGGSLQDSNDLASLRYRLAYTFRQIWYTHEGFVIVTLFAPLVKATEAPGYFSHLFVFEPFS